MELQNELDLPLFIRPVFQEIHYAVTRSGLCKVNGKIRSSRVKRGPGKGRPIYRKDLIVCRSPITTGKHRGGVNHAVDFKLHSL